LSNLNPCLPTLSATDHNYGITVLYNYGFTVILPTKKLENQSFNPFKIGTAHREGTLTPYSVAKLDKGPRGTLKLTFTQKIIITLLRSKFAIKRED
jgi:hypothetical protein